LPTPAATYTSAGRAIVFAKIHFCATNNSPTRSNSSENIFRSAPVNPAAVRVPSKLKSARAPRRGDRRLAENVPYDVQRLAHETWDDVKAADRKSAGLEDLHLTLGWLLNQHHTVFEESWQRLMLAQRAVLRAIVLESGRELLSADVRSRHRLPGASSCSPPWRRSSARTSS